MISQLLYAHWPPSDRSLMTSRLFKEVKAPLPLIKVYMSKLEVAHSFNLDTRTLIERDSFSSSDPHSTAITN